MTDDRAEARALVERLAALLLLAGPNHDPGPSQEQVILEKLREVRAEEREALAVAFAEMPAVAAAIRSRGPAPEKPPPADPVASWPTCTVCGKSAREGKHAFDLGEGHEYVPAPEPTLSERRAAIGRPNDEALQVPAADQRAAIVEAATKVILEWRTGLPTPETMTALAIALEANR